MEFEEEFYQNALDAEAGRSLADYKYEYFRANVDGFEVLRFDTATNRANDPGEVGWDSDFETLAVQMDAGTVLRVGQAVYYRVKNASGSVVIPKMSFVQFAGAAGDTITVQPAVTDGSVLHDYMVGITAEEIPADGFGFVTEFGVIAQVDTDTPAWDIGTLLYPDPTTPGGLTSVQPSAPAFSLPIAAVTRRNSHSGRIFVRMNIGSDLNEIHDVNLSTLSNGEVLKYNSSTGVWENGSAAVEGPLTWGQLAGV